LSLDVLREWGESNPRVRNVVLFVSDALRWDYLPEDVSRRGLTFKTVASGIWSPPSFSSIVTGLYPNNHGVNSFFERLRDGTQSLFTLRGYNSSLWTGNTWLQWKDDLPPIHRILNQNERVSLWDIDPPFVYLEDEKGGHCPYGWQEDDEYEEWDCLRFFDDYGRRARGELQRRYELGIGRSAEELDRCMGILAERGLEDETLVVFLSDHGELLGEHGGNVGHGFMTAPEIAYVPTVFIHPELPRGEVVEDGVLRHVDLYPTILHLLNRPPPEEVDGADIFDSKELPGFGLTYYVMEKRLMGSDFKIVERGVWDKDGGHVFRYGMNRLLLFIRALNLTMAKKDSIISAYQRARLGRLGLIKWSKEYAELLKPFCSAYTKHGDPKIGFDFARSLLNK